MSLSGLLPRQLSPRNRNQVRDRALGALTYVNGWWYGRCALLGTQDLRIRLAGTVDAPAAAARRVLRALDAGRGHLRAQMHPHLWAAFLTDRTEPMPQCPPAPDTIAGRYRLEAACAGAFGEHDMIELAIRAQWSDALIGLYVQDGKVIECRTNLRLWVWPL
jgi:hypothetical protein